MNVCFRRRSPPLVLPLYQVAKNCYRKHKNYRLTDFFDDVDDALVDARVGTGVNVEKIFFSSSLLGPEK